MYIINIWHLTWHEILSQFFNRERGSSYHFSCSSSSCSDISQILQCNLTNSSKFTENVTFHEFTVCSNVNKQYFADCKQIADCKQAADVKCKNIDEFIKICTKMDLIVFL